MLRNATNKHTVARRLISSSTSKAHAPPVVAPAGMARTPEALASQRRLVDPTKPPEFIKTLSVVELFTTMAISALTANAGLVRASSKIMKHTPEPLIRKFVYPIYCGGERFAEVVETGRKLGQRGFGNMMISYSVEDAEGSANDGARIDRAVDEIMASMDQILVKHYDHVAAQYASGATKTRPTAGYIALKPTGLMAHAAAVLKNHKNPSYAGQWAAYLDTCRRVCQHAAERARGKVVVVFDAEKKALQAGVYAAQRAMMREFNKNGVVVMGTLQMYLQDSMARLAGELADARAHKYQLALKVVRGAYTHSEPDRWQDIHRTKAETDASYNAGVSLLLDSMLGGPRDCSSGGEGSVVGRVVVATHNEASMSLVDRRVRDAGLDPAAQERVVFGQLQGMAEDQGAELARRGHRVVKYVPWGPARETRAYLVRRLEENGDTVSVGGWEFAKCGVAELARRAYKAVF